MDMVKNAVLDIFRPTLRLLGQLCLSSSLILTYSGCFDPQTSATVQTTPAALSAIGTTIDVNPSSIPADGIASATITVKLVDIDNNPLVAKSVSLFPIRGIRIDLVIPSSAYTDDQGQVQFTVTSETAGTSTIVVQNLTDHITLSPMVASVQFTPGPVSSFKLFGLSTASVAGVPENLTLSAFDSFGNIATQYTGTIAFSSSDSSVILPSDTPVTLADAGTKTFPVTLTRVGNFSISAIDTVQANLSATLSHLSVEAAEPAQLQVLGFPSSKLAGQSSSFTVRALDAFGNFATSYVGSVSFSSSDPLAILPAPVSFLTNDAGEKTFFATLRTIGTQSLTATDVAHPSMMGSQNSISVSSSSVHHFVISDLPTSAVAGSANLFSVSAVDAFGNLITGYLGTVSFNSTDGASSLPGNYTFQEADAGSHSFGIILKTAGSQGITVQDIGTATLLGKQNTLITPSGTSYLSVSGYPSRQSAGVTGSVSVSAKDVYGNTVTDYTGSVVLTTDDTSAALPAPYSYSLSDHGVHLFPVTLKSLGTHSIIASDTFSVLISGTQTNILISPATAAGLSITGFGTSKAAGSANSLTVSAVDSFGNPVETYTGTISFSSSDTQGLLPGMYSFTASDLGKKTFLVNLRTAGIQTITATDLSQSSIQGTKGSILITPASVSALNSTLVASPSSQIPADGVSTSVITATLRDAYKNLISGTSVLFTATGSSHTLTQPTASSGSSGTVIGTLSSLAIETKTLSISSPSALSSLKVSVSFVAGAFAITSPAQSSYVSSLSNSSTFPVSGYCTIASKTVQIQIDGALASGSVPGTCNGSTFSATIDTTSLSQGPHSLTAISTDGSNNLISSPTISIIKSTLPPSISFTTPNASTSINAANVANFSISGSCSVDGKVVILSITDGNTTVVPSTLPICHLSSTPNFSVLVSLTSLADGSIRFGISQTDNSGNLGTDSLTITKASKLPTISINPASTSSLINASSGSAFTISGSCDQLNQGVSFYVDGSLASMITGTVCNGSTYSGVINPTSISEGSHFLSTTITDLAGNTGTSSLFAMTKDITPPTLSITSPSNNATIVVDSVNGNTYTVAGNCSEANRSVSFSIDGVLSSTGSCDGTNYTTTVDMSVLLNGSHTLTAQMSDSARNSTTTSINFTKRTTLATQLSITGFSDSLNTGVSVLFTLSAKDSFGSLVPNYTGSISFSSTDSAASLPSSYTFLSSDAGKHVFSVTFNTIGVQSLTATDSANTLSVVKSGIAVDGAPVARLSVSNFPSPQTAGTPGNFTVSALDSFGYIVPTYKGTLTFSSTDPLAHLPAQYTFTSSDNGVHTFSATLNTSGIQSITATDNAKALIGTQSGINVYSSLVADWPFSYGTDSAYTFDSTLIRLSSSGVAQLISYTQTDSGSTFNTGTQNGVTYDSSNQVLKLNSSTNIAELDSTWTPAYSNLVGYWKLNGSSSITNGTSIPSTVGPNLTASNANGTGLTYSSGQLNQAISFDGVDDYLYSNTTTMSVSGNFTVAAWAMATSTSGTRSIVGTQNGTANAVELGFLGNYGLYVNVGNGTTNVMSLNTNTTWALSTTTFHHVVLSMKSTGGVLYLDGNTVASGTVTSGTPLLIDSTRTLTIGNSKNAGTAAFIGSIDEVAIWNTALSTAQIQALYQRQSATYSGLFSSQVFGSSSSVSVSSQLPYYKNLPPNASSESTSSYSGLTNSSLMSGNVGLWHFDENAGSTTFADSSGNGNNGTAVGALITGVTGKLGNAIGANGSAGIYVNVPHSASLALTSNLTILAWVYPMNYSGQVFSILGKTWGGSPAPYDFYLNPSAGGAPSLFMGNGTGYAYVTALAGPAMGTWSLLAVTRDGSTGLVTHYLNGITNGSGTLNTTIADQGLALKIGSRTDLGTVLNGYLDEVALWNRVLSATEIQQIYQRGANRIKYQFRSCSSNPCTTESWVGPDGSSQSYFSELYNTSNSTPTGSVKTTPENFTLSNFTGLSFGSQPYFQYRAILESDSATGTSGPTLSAVSLTGTSSSASISTNTAITFTSLMSFNETLGPNGCSQGVYYQLSRDNVLWYYVTNSGVWTLASSASSSQASTASQLNTYASSFSTQVGTGVFYVRAILTSSPTSGTGCELDDIYFLVSRNSLQTAATDTSLSTTSGLVLDYNAYLANYGSAPYVSGCPSSSLSWYDLSTNLFAGTLTNFSSCSATSGWVGAGTSNSPYALAFNGTNNYVSLPTLPLSLNWSSGLTIEAWVYPTATMNNAKFLNIGNGGGSLSSGQGNDDIYFGRSGSTSNLAFGTYSGASQYSGTAVSSSTLQNSFWNHIAVTLKPTTSNLATTTFYMNGTSSTASSGGTQYLPKNIQRSTNFIAESDWSSDAPYQGQIGMLRVFNRPLSSTEITSEYNNSPQNFLSFQKDSTLTTSSGLVLNLNPMRANGGAGPYTTAGCSASQLSWYDFSSNLFAGSLNSFSSCGAASGWVGNGSSTSPYALAFDGTNNYVTLPTLPASISWSSGFTVEAWFYYTNSGNYSRIIDFGNGAPSDNIIIARNYTNPYLFFQVNKGTSGSGAYVNQSSTFNNFTWTHFSATITPSGVATIYINGVYDASTSSNLLPNSVNRTLVLVGKSNWTGNSLFAGQLGIIRMFNRALSASEIAAEYAASNTIY